MILLDDRTDPKQPVTSRTDLADMAQCGVVLAEMARAS